MISSIMNTATAGLLGASQRLAVSAGNIASQTATSTIAAPQQLALPLEGGSARPAMGLAGEIVNQQIASYDFKANLKVIKVADDMARETLNITA